MWKKTRLHIQLDDRWPDLTTGKRHTRLLNNVCAAHSLGREKHVRTSFRLKNNKYIMKILKRLHGLFNYTKYLQRQRFFFLIFSEAKSVIWLYLKIKKTWISLSKKAKEIFICSRKDKKLKMNLLLQFTVKAFSIYSDFSISFNFYYNIYARLNNGCWLLNDASSPLTTLFPIWGNKILPFRGIKAKKIYRKQMVGYGFDYIIHLSSFNVFS
jgi:hypothetical protein